MEVKQGKAYASLTEVKNKLGDVFALADEHGEVYISSYNKPKYIISRIHSSEREKHASPAPVKKVVATKPQPIKPPRKELSYKLTSAKPGIEARDWNRNHGLESEWVKKLKN